VMTQAGAASLRRESTLIAEDNTIPLDLPGESPSLTLETALDGDSVTWRLAGDGLRCGWLRPLADFCPLATTRIEGQAAAGAIANFGGQILLNTIEFESGQLTPGAPLTVAVEWQSLTAIDEDYTVFVQLIGPDGRPHGQVDTWPVQGTYPTSAWSAGERVADRYTVTLDGDAPSGSYQLWVGMYLLSTNTRLPLLGADGFPIDDKAAFEGLIVP
jgi:hypothetical protein